MGLFRKLRKIISVIFENESEQKGDDFEKYVVDLFDEKQFSIVQWTTDMARKHTRFVDPTAALTLSSATSPPMKSSA